MRYCSMHPSLVVLLTLLRSLPTTGAGAGANVFQDDTASAGAEAWGGPGGGNNVADDDGGAYIDIPYGCQGQELNGKKLEDCIDQWYTEYYADGEIPEDCVDLVGLELHNCVELYLSSLSASPTLLPTPSPTLVFVEEPQTPPPSEDELYHTAALPIDVTTMVELPSGSNIPDEATKEDDEKDQSTIVYVNDYVELGNFDMSITIYSSPRTNRHRLRSLQHDDGDTFSMHELDATKLYLQQVYQERFPDLNVNALQLRFTDGGETVFSQGVIRHSKFNGTVGFESASPSEEELESATLDAFVGKSNKKAFLELFHSAFAEGDNVESSSKGRVNVANLYDVSVRKALENDDASTQGADDVTEDVPTMENSQQTAQDNSSGNSNLIVTVVCVVVVAVVLLLGSVYFRGRRLEQQKARSNLKYAKYVDENGAVEKLDNDEEKLFQYDMNDITMECTNSGDKENNSEEESIQSSLSSNLADEAEQSNLEQPYPLEISPSDLEEINNQSLRHHSGLVLCQDEQDGNASTTWTFTAVGADIDNCSQGGASIGYSVGGVSDIIRNMKDFEEMEESNEPSSGAYDEGKGRSNQEVECEDDQLSFLGSVNSNPEDRRQIDSFIKEILSRDDLDADE